MAAKQQYFLNSYIVKVDNSHILNLDAPVEYATSKFATLRKCLMSRSPKNSVIQRIFVSVDKSWRGNDFTLVTVKPYAANAIKALNCMVPECTYLYGEAAAKRWFSNTGLLAYQNVNWDPSTQATTSHQDHTTQALVEEDLFELGSAWMNQAPILQPQANRPQSQEPQYLVKNLLKARETDTYIHSFGSVYGRQHDGARIGGSQQKHNLHLYPIQLSSSTKLIPTWNQEVKKRKTTHIPTMHHRLDLPWDRQEQNSTRKVETWIDS
jgi:hypothetical protein